MAGVRVPFYEEFLLKFEDGSHPDVTVVLNRNDAQRIKAGDKDFIEQIKASLIESEAEKDARSCAAAEGKAEESERSNISSRLPAEEKAKESERSNISSRLPAEEKASKCLLLEDIFVRVGLFFF
uniref:Uncharacterized protein LOC111119497 n=1 Tax=Crassostrea virginica TaxID=6565 RepID=A0A8B8CJQ8_CRAVI|nr:uncharacterized protein LOC111119497 [Crassostrea virginica]